MLPTVAPDPRSAIPLRQFHRCRTRSYYRPRGLVTGAGTTAPIPGRRGGSWRPPARTSVPAWSGATAWLHALQAVLASPAGEVHRRRLSVRLETAVDVAAEDARAADSRTGRHVTTSHATVAALLDEMAEIPGLRGVMLTFDDFVIGMDQFGTRIQPLMKSRAHILAAA